MSGGLVLRLRPHEKFLVNGVVIENGGRRARLCVRSQDANILRIREALHPDEVNTPAKRLYYVAQLAVAGEADAEETREALVPGIEALRQAFGGRLCTDEFAAALEHAHEGDFYRVMRALSRIMPVEEALLKGARGGEAAPAQEDV